jgi:ATPase family associated with various cellular activities (AAA)/Domain of unknown function (DUF5925)
VGRTLVTVGRERTERSRRRAALRSLAASGVVPTYDLLYGNQCGLLFESATLEAGFRETGGTWWPTEARALHAEGAVFREGDTGALYQLDDGTLVHAHLTDDAIRLQIAGPTRASVGAALAAFQGLYPASFVTTDGDSRVPITFWSNSQFGPVPRLRRIDATAWDPIVGNYSAEVAGQLSDLMAWREPTSDGQLILWQGPPGTGKTWALRALASEWAPWAEFNYITDPDSFFVDDPSYMVNVLLSDSYQVMDSDGGVFEEQAEGKWRVLILEDTGELLSANAKEKYGQGLSRLLNVVDGMIGQGLRVLCLVTTNDELGELNEAVRRPGRCASQIVFGPLDDGEAQEWTGDPAATAGTIAELYSTYGKAEPRPAEFEDEPEDARDLMASLRAEFAKPITLTDAERRSQIAAVAEKHADKATGYGQTWWSASTGSVFWNAGDWTSEDDCDAVAADFLEVQGVDAFAYDCEVGQPDGADDWEQVWPGSGDLAAVVALALEPLVVEADPVLVAAVTEAVESAAAEPVLEPIATSDRLIDVLALFAERDQPPAPTFHLHFPQHLGVTLERQDVTVPITLEPTPPTPVEVHSHTDVHVPEQAPATVTVQAADPAPLHVDVHVPEQPAPRVDVHVPASEPRPTAVRVHFDANGDKVYIPVHDEQEATT